MSLSIRRTLLKPKIEEQLKGELAESWSKGKTGKEIATKLQFGVKGTIYEKVKPSYVYYYRQKFAKDAPEFFPTRKDPAFAKNTPSARDGLRRSRYKMYPESFGIIEYEEFVETLNEKLSLERLNNSFYCKCARSYLILHFWTPLRSSEIYERTISDFEITKSKITIHLLRKKKHHVKGDKDEPIDVLRALPLVEEVINWLEGKEWKKPIKDKKGNIVTDDKGEVIFNLRPWDISHDTALNYVKAVFPDSYPHYFRFRFLTNAASDPETTSVELKSKSRLTLSALDHYIMAPRVVEIRFDRRQIKQLKERGVIK